MSALDDLVLALTTYLPGGLDWKPDLHPRDHNGMFKKKFGGVFNPLGDLKSAKYASAGVFKTPGHEHGVNLDVPTVAPGEKVGGIEIHAPTEHGYKPSVHSVDWKLKAGDKVYKVTGGPDNGQAQNGVIQHHQDGSATALMPTPDGEMPKVGLQSTHFSDMQANLQAMGYEIDTEHPLDINTEEEAAKYAAEVAEVEHAKEIGAAPQSAYGKAAEGDSAATGDKPEPKPAVEVGKTGPGGNPVAQALQDDNGKHIGHIEKTPEGKYTSHDAKGNKVGNISKHVATAVEKVKSGKLTTPQTYEHKKPAKAAAKEAAKEAPKVTEPVTKKPEPTVEPKSVVLDTAQKAAAELKTKLDAKSEAKPAEEHKEPAHLEGKSVFQHVHDDNGKHIGHIEKLSNGKFTSHNAEGDKIGNITKHLPTAIDKVKSGKLTTPDTYNHKKSSEPKAVEEDVKVVKDGDKQNIIGDNGSILGHVEKDATTGKWQSYDGKGAKIGYTIGNLQTAIDKVKNQSVTQPGYKKPAKAEQDKLPEPEPLADWEKELLAEHIGVKPAEPESSFKQELKEVASQKTEVPEFGGSVDLLPGEAIYTLKDSMSPFVAVVADGKVQYVQNPSTGVKKVPGDTSSFGMAIIASWQDELDAGKMGKYGEVAPEEAPVTPATEAKVEEALALPGLPTVKMGDKEIQLQPGEKHWVDKTHPEWGSWIEKPSGLADGYLDDGTKAVPDATMPNLTDPATGDWHVVAQGPDVETPDHSEKNPSQPAEVWKTTSGTSFVLYADGTGELFTATGKKVSQSAQPEGVAGAQAMLKTISDNKFDNWKKQDVPGADNVVAKPKAGATPKVAKKKVVKDTDLPDTYSSGAKTFTAKPGDAIFTKEIDGDTFIAHLKGSLNGVHFYDTNGNASYQFTQGKKMSLAALKKQGWDKVAVGAPKQVIDKPTVEPDKEYGYSVYGYADNVWSALTGWGTPLYKSPDVLSTDTVGDAIALRYANLQYAKEHPEEFNLDKSDKMKVTKGLNFVSALWDAHVLAKKLDSPDYEPTEADKVTLQESHSQFSKQKAYTAQGLTTGLAEKVKTAEFKKGLSSLGFDIEHGTHEEFVNYAGQNGASFIGGMEPGDVKNWVHSHLNVLGYSGPSKAKIEASASQALKMKAVAAHATSVMEKKKALAPTKEEQLVHKAEVKEYNALQKKISQLKTDYILPDVENASIERIGSMQWSAYGPDVTGNGSHTNTFFTAEQLVEFLDSHPQWKPASYATTLGSAQAQKVDQIVEEDGWDHDYLQNPTSTMLTDLGASGAADMTDATKRQWLLAHVNGDSIAQYQIEHAALSSAGMDTTLLSLQHPGGSMSPEGLVANQTLADHLATIPEWSSKEFPDSLSEWTDAEASSFLEKFGVIEADHALGNQTAPHKLLSTWLKTHANLPPAKTSDTVSGDGTIKTDNGSEFTVPHGSYVLKVLNINTKSYTFLVASPEGFYNTNENGEKITNVVPYDQTSWSSPQETIAVFAGAGTDVTPKWANPSTHEHQPAEPVAKPADFPQHIWDFVTGAEVGGKDLADLIGSEFANASDELIASYIKNASSYFSYGEKLKVLSASPSIQKLAAWAVQQATQDPSAGKILEAIKHKAAANDYVTPETEKWTLPGTNHTFVIPPGASVHKVEGAYYVHINSKASYALLLSGEVGYASVYLQSNFNSDNQVFTSKANISLDKALSEGQGFTQAAFDKLNAAELGTVWKSHLAEPTAAWEFKNAIEDIDGGEKYAKYTNLLHTLPVGVKQLAMEAARKKDTDSLDAFAWKHAKGAYDLQPEQPTGPVVDPSAIYADQIAAGHVTQDDIDGYWTTAQINQFINDYKLPGVSEFSSYGEKAPVVAEALKAFTPKKPVTQQEAISKGMADWQNLELTKIDKTYGGMHTKQGYADKYGQEWMAKGFNSDPNGPFRVDVEHTANLIGHLLGFNSADTFTKTVDGKYSVIQRIADSDGDLVGYQPKDLNTDQLVATMQEHVLDWLVSNHDTHKENILRLPGGSQMLGIDKGQAFKHLHDDKLAVGYKPPENGAPVWYDQFYNGVINNTVDEATANNVAFKVLQKAYAVQTRQDARYRELLEAAMASRTSWPSALPNKEAFIQAAMDRKANMLSDFENLYKGIFDKAGYEWKIDTEEFGKTVGTAHITNGKNYADAVSKSSVFGQSLMFNSPDLEDSHLVHNTMVQMDGGKALLGTGKVRSDADKLLTAWLKDRVEGKLTSGQKAPAVSGPSAVLPSIGNFHEAIVGYAKTVTQHAPNGGKEPDGKYNDSYVSNAQNQAAVIKDTFDKAVDFRAANPDKLYSGSPSLTTLEQQNAWIAAMDQKLKEFDLVKQAHDQGVPLKSLNPDIKNFEKVAYEPSKGLKKHSEAGPLAKYDLGNGEIATKTSDGGFYFENSSGDKTHASAQDFANATAGKKLLPLSGSEAETWKGPGGTNFIKQADGSWKHDGSGDTVADADLMETIQAYPADWTHSGGGGEQEDKTQTVQIANKVFTVTHRKAAIHGGLLDPTKGKLVEQSASNQALQTGYEYTIEHGNVKIHYRPWNGESVARSQQGQLSYEVRNWDGDHAAIDDVLDTLRIAGLDLSSADAESLEHHYWNHLTNVIQDRADANLYDPIVEHVNKGLVGKQLSTGEHLSLLKEAWAKHIGQDKVDAANWTPQFSTIYGEEGGHPFWLRPDFGVADLKDHYGTKLPIHRVHLSNFNGDEDKERLERAHKILLTGRLVATEERPRIGVAGSGMSSHDDQLAGSSGFVFTRQNISASAIPGNPAFIMNPLSALRSTTYTYYTDHYGNLDYRKQDAYFSPAQMYGHKGSSNEMMVKNEAPFLYAIYGNATERNNEIKRLKSEGATEIHGRPLEEVVITQDMWNSEYQDRVEKIWQQLIEDEKKYMEGN